jgi:iron complex outermembrane receptor protein
MRFRFLLLPALALSLTCSVFADVRRTFALPAGDAAQTLRQFAQQAGREVVYPAEEVRGQQTNPVRGEFLVSDALRQLLAGTALVAELDRQTGAFAVRKGGPAPKVARVAPHAEGNGATTDSTGGTRAPTDEEVMRARAAPEGTIKLDPFTVQGYRSSLSDAIEAKRNAGQVMDSITAEEIGQFGDQDVGEAIQRISGVSLTRNNGEGQFVSIRGMAPDFTRVEIDGRSTFMTSDQSDAGRAVLLSVFSSDLYNNIEVVKSTTAADTEGGAGGVVRLKSPDPLAGGRLRWGFKARVMDAQMRDRREPNFSAYHSNVLLDKRLGFLLAATYDKRDRRLDKVQMGDPVWQPATSTNASLNGGWYPSRLRLEGRTGDMPKFNLNAKVQFMATPDLQLYANTVITREKRTENKSRLQVEFSNGTFVTGTLDPATKTLVAGQFTNQQVNYNDFVRDTRVDTTGVTGGLIWKPAHWNIEAKASSSHSIEDFDEYQAQARIARDGVGGYELGEDPRTPRLYTASTTLAPAQIPLRGLNDNKRITEIGETEFQVDAKRMFRGRAIKAVRLGLRGAETEFKRRQGGPPSANISGLTFANGVTPFVLDGSFGRGRGGADFLRLWPEVNPKELYYKYAPAGPVVFNDSNFYTTREENRAGYVMADFTQSAGEIVVQGNLGVRVVQTDYRGSGRVTLVTPTQTHVLDGEPALRARYREPLPSFNATVAPYRDSPLLVRGAITRSMTRPTVSQINPSTEINTTNRSMTRGNPELLPYLAWQYDLGAEYYFGRKNAALFAVSGFAKDVANFIVPNVTVENHAYPGQGVAAQDYFVNTFRNGGKASIVGAELSFQTPFTFLPGFLRDCGVALNYTYTDSEFTDANGRQFTFPGASKNTYNVQLYYEKNAFSTRLAYNERSDYLVSPSASPNGTNVTYGEGSGRLDWSVRYRFKNGFRVTLDAMNLTREQTYLYYDIPQRFQNFEFEGRIISVGVGYAF